MILVTGGARSGKSRPAEALIGDAPQVLDLAP
ncbi:bifunctional adenosylcobinamide kinase/adenosylcobinamide-phosphate guanylyltransferase, partial [Salmonella enterica subsp. enterica serovar Enteritidis]|nr:bifunctional adenosylcobinamide kinase/adenosylcobinamide-phosphate guanylyltransferase [Salmonella enterica subsp. enterica serovar Enteritidis]